MNKPRVVFFPDSFLEVNGVAMTCKRLVAYAKNNGYPMLCVHAGNEAEITQDGSITFLSLKRSPFSFSLDEGLAYDPFLQLQNKTVLRELEKFRPDVVHITGLNDVSITGAYLSWKKHLPMVASWHTNLHEFGSHRLKQLFSRILPSKVVSKISNFAERKILAGAILYYKMPKIVLAPNRELVEMLQDRTERSSRLMLRGVDTDLFSPEKRTVNNGVFTFGSVGRLRPEKNVRLLADIERELIRAGKSNFRFLIVGEGSEREYLENNMQNAEFTGFLNGEKLSEAYANMDVLIFPSDTDTFGNVTQEANASGVPTIVSDKGGPKYLIEHGWNGFVAKDLDEFVKFSLEMMEDPEALGCMKSYSREKSLSRMWDAVFEGVYDAYSECIAIANETGKASSDPANYSQLQKPVERVKFSS